jgi:hypothetical protein
MNLRPVFVYQSMHRFQFDDNRIKTDKVGDVLLHERAFLVSQVQWRLCFVRNLPIG